jgi:hypothetical protein
VTGKIFLCGENCFCRISICINRRGQNCCAWVTLQQIVGNGGVDEEVEESESGDAEAEAVIAAVIGQDEEAKMRNRAAKGHVLVFLGPTQRRQLLHLPGGLEVWADLHTKYEQWQDARGPALQRQYDLFKPKAAETVVAMCNRFDGLCLQLSRVGMAPAPRVAIQHLVRQLKADRPVWVGYLQGMWQVLPAAAKLSKVRPDRVT